MELNDMQLLFAADVAIAELSIPVPGGGNKLIALTLTCHHNGQRGDLQPVFLNADAARTVALQLLDAADRAEGSSRTQHAN